MLLSHAHIHTYMHTHIHNFFLKQVTRQMAAKADADLPFSALTEYYSTIEDPPAIPYRYLSNFLGASWNFKLVTISLP